MSHGSAYLVSDSAPAAGPWRSRRRVRPIECLEPILLGIDHVRAFLRLRMGTCLRELPRRAGPIPPALTRAFVSMIVAALGGV
jgi:hypothetical protein